jgi:hypothetical protein
LEECCDFKPSICNNDLYLWYWYHVWVVLMGCGLGWILAAFVCI